MVIFHSYVSLPEGIKFHELLFIYKWANAQVPPTPFQGRSGAERSKRPTRAVVQTYKYYGTFEGLGSVNIDCGTMNLDIRDFRVCSSEGCEVLKPSTKAAAEVLRVLRALEICCGGFEGFKACPKRAT